jgi:hypothetical protein
LSFILGDFVDVSVELAFAPIPMDTLSRDQSLFAIVVELSRQRQRPNVLRLVELQLSLQRSSDLVAISYLGSSSRSKLENCTHKSNG